MKGCRRVNRVKGINGFLLRSEGKSCNEYKLDIVGELSRGNCGRGSVL